MTTTTSCSKPGQFAHLYKLTMKKQIPAISLYTILLLLTAALPYFSDHLGNVGKYVRYGGSYTGNDFSHLVLGFMVFILPIFVAAELFAYLHNRRAVDFYHGLPVPRQTMMLSQFAAGFTIVAVPMLICQLVSLSAFLVFPNRLAPLHTAFWGMAKETLIWLCMIFIMLSIATFVAVICSTTIELLGYSVSIAVLGSAVFFVFYTLAQQSLFGYWIRDTNSFFFLSPFGVMALGASKTWEIAAQTIAAIAVWAVIAAGLLMAAVYIYRKRDSEAAEQWGRSTPLSRVIKLFAAFTGAFFLSMMLDLFFPSATKGFYTVAALIGAPLAYILVEAITAKGFSTIKKVLPRVGVSTLVVALCFSYYSFSGFGYETKLPNPASVSSVELSLATPYNSGQAKEEGLLAAKNIEEITYWPSNSQTELKTQEAIAKVVDLQNSLINQHKLSPDNDSYAYRYNRDTSFSYKLQPIGKMERNYSLSQQQWGAVVAIYADDEYTSLTHPAFRIEPVQVEGFTITDKLGTGIKSDSLDEARANQLLEAIRQDLLAETTESLTDLTNNLELGSLELNLKDPIALRDAGVEPLLLDNTCQVLLRPSFTATLALLNEWGATVTGNIGTVTTVNIAYSNRGRQDIFHVEAPVQNSSRYADKDNFINTLQVTDPALIEKILAISTSIYSGKGTENVVSAMMPGIGASTMYTDLSVDNAALIEILDGSGLKLPYLLTASERQAYIDSREDPADAPAYVNDTKEYSQDLHKEENFMEWTDCITMGDYFRQHLPKLLEGKSPAQLRAIDITPLEDKDGTPIYLNNIINN